MSRLVYAIDRNVRRLLAAIESLHTGVLLGLLRRGSLERLTSISYDARSLYLDADHNASGLFDWERDALDRHFPPGSKLLLGGCGGGRELLALAAAGFVVDAFDPNSGYVASAQRALAKTELPGRVLRAAPDSVPDGFAGPYDGLVLGWGMYTHVAGRQQRIAMLRGLHSRAVAGAPILLSFLARQERSRRDRLQHGVARIFAALSFNRRRPEVGDDLNQQAFVHWFDETELSNEMREAGFRLAAFSPRPYGHAIGLRD
ncbi:hypothetical protein [Arenimonas sp.]|uniref:hypothetical protein n=1 Tax=Arenimonas sp. TaxID=1872635 RepID=UPI0039E6DB3A